EMRSPVSARTTTSTTGPAPSAVVRTSSPSPLKPSQVSAAGRVPSRAPVAVSWTHVRPPSVTASLLPSSDRSSATEDCGALGTAPAGRCTTPPPTVRTASLRVFLLKYATVVPSPLTATGAAPQNDLPSSVRARVCASARTWRLPLWRTSHHGPHGRCSLGLAQVLSVA